MALQEVSHLIAKRTGCRGRSKLAETRVSGLGNSDCVIAPLRLKELRQIDLVRCRLVAADREDRVVDLFAQTARRAVHGQDVLQG